MKKLTPAAMDFAARSLCAMRGFEAPGGPVLDSARLEIERLAQAAAAWEMGEAFDRYVGQRAALTRDVRLGEPGAFLVSGAEVRVVGIVDDETFSVEPADLPGDSVAVSLYDLAFFPEGDAQAPQERETPPTLDLGDATPETPRHGPQTAAQDIAESLDAVAAPTLQTLRHRAEAWYGVCKALDDVDPEWTGRAATGGEAAVASVRWLGARPAPPTATVGQVSPETPRHGPQTAAQAMPATASDVSVGYYTPARPLTVEEVDQLAQVCVEYDAARRKAETTGPNTAARYQVEADELRGRILAMVGRLVPVVPAAAPVEPVATTEPQGSGCGVDGCEVCGG